MYGLIEAGGTKFVLAHANAKGELSESVSLPTLTPDKTIPEVIAYFQNLPEKLTGLAIASFGPLEINPLNKKYGYITSTPKLAWQNYNFVGAFKSVFPNIPIVFDTDVNLAALGEYYAAEAKLGSVLYLTVGTGIGGGYVHSGKILNAYGHPEMGHILVTPNPNDKFTGTCPFHKYCLEGMAAGPSIKARLGINGQDLDINQPIFAILANYLAQALLAYTVILRPEAIKLGGGVMQKANFIDLVRANFAKLLNNYLKTPNLTEYIQLPKLNGRSALYGCLKALQNLE